MTATFSKLRFSPHFIENFTFLVVTLRHYSILAFLYWPSDCFRVNFGQFSEIVKK